MEEQKTVVEAMREAEPPVDITEVVSLKRQMDLLLAENKRLRELVGIETQCREGWFRVAQECQVREDKLKTELSDLKRRCTTMVDEEGHKWQGYQGIFTLIYYPRPETNRPVALVLMHSAATLCTRGTFIWFAIRPDTVTWETGQANDMDKAIGQAKASARKLMETKVQLHVD